MGRINEALGQVGLPAPISESGARLGCRDRGWWAQRPHRSGIFGARGLGVIVLERAPRLGGACTLEQPFDDPAYLVSPCAYLVGLLHPLVVEELELHRRGYEVRIVDPHLWCPFEDGTSIALWNDAERSAEAVRQLRQATWTGSSPTRLSSRDFGGHYVKGRATPGWAMHRNAPR